MSEVALLRDVLLWLWTFDRLYLRVNFQDDGEMGEINWQMSRAYCTISKVLNIATCNPWPRGV